MTLRQYLAWLAIGTLISWGALALVMIYLSPETAGNTGFLFFYLSMFLSLGGTFTIIGFAWRYWRHRDDVLFRHVSISFRQGLILSLAVVMASWLRANQLLTWWNTGLLVVGLTLLEFFWLSVRRSPSPPI